MVARLSCLRGISTLAARVIVSEVYDLRRFATASQFMAFLGVVPSEQVRMLVLAVALRF